MEITLLRHGESEGNAEGFHQGQMDYPLTDLGREQAQKLADRWVDEEVMFDRIIASPLLRARETAEIIQQALDIPLEFDDVWMERHCGMLAGKKRNRTDKLHSNTRFQNLYEANGGTGESDWQLHLRAGQGYQKLMRRTEEKLLVVGHGGTFNYTVHAALGISPAANQQAANFPHNNTSFTKIRFNKEEQFTELVSANDHFHLDGNPDVHGDHKFTFIRHGESVGNFEKRFQGQAEFPLTALGRKQAQALADRLADSGEKFTKIIASSQDRTMETAAPIAQALGMEIEANPLWKEVHNGKFSGLLGTEIDAMPDGRTHWENPFSPIGETGESWWELQLRAGHALQNLMERKAGHYIIVSHGGTLNALLRNILGISLKPKSQIPYFRFHNTSMTQLGYKAEKNRWVLWNHGDIQHLKDLN